MTDTVKGTNAPSSGFRLPVVFVIGDSAKVFSLE
jgi:hypothetical protein